jgi:hypothetical protein
VNPARGIFAVVLVLASFLAVALFWMASIERDQAARDWSAADAAANGETLQLTLHTKELQCEREFIGVASDSWAHHYCHERLAHEWAQWACDFPEQAKARTEEKAALAATE